MNPFAAYQQAQNLPPTRIDLLLELYRKALDCLAKARLKLTENDTQSARPFLLKAQLIVMGMASGLPAYKDESAINFLRLYEFASRQMTLGATENIDGAAQVLQTLKEGFEAVREQAIALERQGKIPPLDRDHLVSMSA